MIRLGTLACAVLLGVLLGGCPAKESPPIRVGTNTWPGYEPFYLAEDIGAYERGAVRMLRHRSATDVQRALVASRIDAAALTLDEALLLLEAGQDPLVVLVIDTSNGGDAIIARTEIKGVRDLPGRRLGVEKTGVGAYMAQRALQLAGVRRDDVTLVDLPADRHAAAFLGGNVDAVVTFEPTRSALLLAGGREIFSSAEIPGEIVDVLVVNRAFLERHPERVRQLLRGWFEALRYMETNPSKAALRISMRLHLKPEEVTRSYKGLDLPGSAENTRLLIGERGIPALAEPASRLAASMRAMGLLHRPVKPAQLFSPPDNGHPLLTLKGKG